MDFDRRDWLKKTIGLGVLAITPKILLAEDYSIKNHPEQKKYIYNPFTPVLKKQEADYISNDILPENNAQYSFWDAPRTIYLQRSSTKENARIVYYNNKKINEEGYKLACYLLRDVKQNQVANIDLRLLDLVSAVQAWLVYYGYKNPILVNSGFRTNKTNSGLEGAAKNSMHLYGKAIDFTVPGFSPAKLGQIASQFRAGGIGIYPNSNFIHLDTGGVRVWTKR